MSVYKRCKTFFRNTLVAHKQTEKPYFMGLEVHQEIIPNKLRVLPYPLKVQYFQGVFYAVYNFFAGVIKKLFFIKYYAILILFYIEIF